MKEQKEKFINGAIDKGYSKELGEEMFELIEYFASYGFNRCVSKDTKLERASANQYVDKYLTIEELYENWHSDTQVGQKYRNPDRGISILSYFPDGRVRPRQVKNVYKTGVKPVYKIELSDGRTIKSTKDHKFYNSQGEWKKLEDLIIGEELLVKNKYKSKKYRYSLSNKKQNNKKIGFKGHKGFKKGKDNPGYIDGSYIEFEKCKEIVFKRSNGKCEICDVEEERMEYHHVDGDRSNNTPDNMKYLCVSCHKKEEYKLGRNRKWDRGYSVTPTEIINIEYIGEEQTYDLEMYSDDEMGHNYIANDIVTHNSHSAAYAMISYVTAFLKYYFPAEFYASLISFEAEKTFSDSSIKEYIADCYGRKIKILPPDINYSKKKFVSQNGDILFGINIIKGVGEKAVEEIIANRPYEDLYDFVDKVDNRVVNKTVVESLIKGGAFDFVDDNRNDLLDKYLNDKSNNSNTMALFSESLETTKKEVIAYEQEVLNISLTYPNRWLMVSDNEPFSIEGEIVEISELKTKNDRDMAFIKIQTILTEIKCILFPRQYDAYINDIQIGDEILVDGKKNGNALQIRDIRWG